MLKFFCFIKPRKKGRGFDPSLNKKLMLFSSTIRTFNAPAF